MIDCHLLQDISHFNLLAIYFMLIHQLTNSNKNCTVEVDLTVINYCLLNLSILTNQTVDHLTIRSFSLLHVYC